MDSSMSSKMSEPLLAPAADEQIIPANKQTTVRLPSLGSTR